MEFRYFNRDISWLSFNERVLMEAEREHVPLMERIRFLSIYSSNLDEFYRVRMPVLQNLGRKNKSRSVYQEAADVINRQQNLYGEILRESVIPKLRDFKIHFCYEEGIPECVKSFTTNYFFSQIAGFLQPVMLEKESAFFPENNQLYLVVVMHSDQNEKIALVNIPADKIGRFAKIKVQDEMHVVFLEDIIKDNLKHLFPDATEINAFSIKITRDAELDIIEEAGDDITEKFEKQLKKRDYGFATRFLYEPGLPSKYLSRIVKIFDLKKASLVEGGSYHNLKDLAAFPANSHEMSYPSWPAIGTGIKIESTLFKVLENHDLMVHAPYQTYDTILRFFNEAAITPAVEEIYTTLYRVAHDSKIAQALISAAKNGKKVTVLVELKARFDEANNIRWAKKMKAAGVKIVHSVNTIKVHAKIALVKRKSEHNPYLGLLATGNLNEGTARFYTDHILLTSHQEMLAEARNLFRFLSKKKKPELSDVIPFRHLLVAQFNLQTRFLSLLDREILNAKNGLPSGVTIKLNNLEEEVMINKLYEASNAGVKINLLVRSVCRLIPGIFGQSEHITIKRIVDRYLEHGRVFVFHNAGEPEIFMGSADWMNRNIYRRIEVCFPVYDPKLKEQLTEIISLQWNDTMQAVLIDSALNNVVQDESGDGIRSQEAIYKLLNSD